MSDYPPPPPPSYPPPPGPAGSAPPPAPAGFAPPGVLPPPDSHPPQFGYDQWVRPPRSGHNGVSIAGFILSFFGGNLISVGLNIAGLREANRKNQKRGLAVAGLAIAGAWTVAGVVLIAYAVATSPSRDSTGAYTAPATVDAGAVRTGDCVNGLAPSDQVTDIEVVPCTQPHEGEAFGEKTIAGDVFPGEKAVKDQANEVCPELLETYAPGEDLDIVFLHPTERSWRLKQDRLITCVAMHDTPQTGSVKG